MTRDALPRIDGYMFDVELLMLAHRLGFGIKEVPIRWRDDNDSRLQLLSGNFRNAIDIFKIRLHLRRISPAPVAMSVAATISNEVSDRLPGQI